MGSKIFLAGICVNFTSKDIINYFAKKYNTEASAFDVELKLGKHKRNVGWAILKAKNPEIYQEILDTHLFELGSRKFFAKKFLKGDKRKKYREDVQNRRVYLKGIPRRVDNKGLVQALSKYGKIEDAYIIKHYQNAHSSQFVHTNYGFAVFKLKEDASKLLDMTFIKMKNQTVFVTKYQIKEKQEKPRKGAKKLESESKTPDQKKSSKKVHKREKNGKPNSKDRRTPQLNSPVSGKIKLKGDNRCQPLGQNSSPENKEESSRVQLKERKESNGQSMEESGDSNSKPKHRPLLSSEALKNQCSIYRNHYGMNISLNISLNYRNFYRNVSHRNMM